MIDDDDGEEHSKLLTNNEDVPSQMVLGRPSQLTNRVRCPMSMSTSMSMRGPIRVNPTGGLLFDVGGVHLGLDMI